MSGRRKTLKPELPDHRDCLGLSEAVRTNPAFQEKGRELRYRKGAYIWRPEDKAESLYWLQEGQVVELRGPAAKAIITRVVVPGEPFGHLCFCTPKGGMRGNSARVTLGARILEVKFAVVLSALQTDAKLLTEVLFQFCMRLTGTERRLEILTYRGAKERLGHLLLDLGESRGAPVDTADDVAIPITHDQLAQMAAMSRSHVTVTMVLFRKAGLLQYGRDQPLVIRLSPLRRYLDKSS